jgi:2-dehydro-3-deoxyglucarate aldolase/4-hydroxy-2-oxoheptanedioate aldolase
MFVSLKQRLARGETVIVAAIGRIVHHNLVQIIGAVGGYHALWFDLEHMDFTTAELEILAISARSHGMDSFVRLAPTDYATVTRALEAGTGGIMAAQVKTAAQVEEIVTWAKFFPRGRRGLNTSGFDANWGLTPIAEFTKKANDETLVAIQIETAEAVDNVAGIAAVEGVDMLFIGPADLSQNLGVTGDFMHPRCVAAIEKVSAACAAVKKPWGVLPPTLEFGQLCLSQGCRMLSLASDSRIVTAGLQFIHGKFEPLFKHGSPTN